MCVAYLGLVVAGDLGLEPEVDDAELVGHGEPLVGPVGAARGLAAVHQRVLARVVRYLT